MQASEPRPRHRSAWNLGYCGATAGGSFLHKRVVRSIVVIVGDVLVEQSPEVPLVENTTTWSSNSRRTLPIQRSATPFCQGLRYAVLVGRRPSDATMETTRSPKLASRSNTKWRRLSSCGKVS